MNTCNLYFLNNIYNIEFKLENIEINSSGPDKEIICNIVNSVIKNNKIRKNDLKSFKFLFYTELKKYLETLLRKNMLLETKVKIQNEIKMISDIINLIKGGNQTKKICGEWECSRYFRLERECKEL